jgi:hypothetical protein
MTSGIGSAACPPRTLLAAPVHVTVMFCDLVETISPRPMKTSSGNLSATQLRISLPAIAKAFARKNSAICVTDCDQIATPELEAPPLPARSVRNSLLALS